MKRWQVKNEMIGAVGRAVGPYDDWDRIQDRSRFQIPDPNF